MTYEKNPDEIGALWAKKTKNGKPMFSGMIEVQGEKINIVCFLNSYKREDKHPDYKILISRPRDSGEYAQAEGFAPIVQNAPRTHQDAPGREEGGRDDNGYDQAKKRENDDIPF